MLAFNLWFAESDPHIEEIYVGFSSEEERKMIEKDLKYDFQDRSLLVIIDGKFSVDRKVIMCTHGAELLNIVLKLDGKVVRMPVVVFEEINNEEEDNRR